MQASIVARWQNSLLSILAVSLCLIVGWYAQQKYQQWDVTAESRHSLKETSVAVLKMFDGPVDALAVVGPEKSQRDAISKLFSKYQQHKADLHLEFLNPETHPSEVQTLQANPAGEIILSFNGQEQRLNSLSERSLTDALQRLARPSHRKVLFVSGHKERDPNSAGNSHYAEISQQLTAIGFKIDTISLVTQPVIPSDTHIVVLAAPQQKYFPGEVASLLNYISAGGTLLWLHDTGASNTGLRALEIELGVSPLPGVVIDASSQQFNIDSPTFTVIDAYPANPITAGFSSITLFPEAVALQLLPMQDRSLLPLLVSSERSWTEHGAIEGQIQFDETSDEQAGPLTVGLTIERDRNAQRQRIAIIGDADFMANTWLGNGGNVELAKRLFNWLGTDDSMLEFTSPTPADSQLQVSSNTLIYLAVFFLAVVPLLLIAMALYNWRRLRKN